jgi:hypothetical protein
MTAVTWVREALTCGSSLLELPSCNLALGLRPVPVPLPSTVPPHVELVERDEARPAFLVLWGQVPAGVEKVLTPSVGVDILST